MAKGYLSEIFVSFQGEGCEVGRRQLFIRLSGCNLRCRYCDTPDSLERQSRYTVHAGSQTVAGTNPLAPSEVVDRVLRLIDAEHGVDGLSVTGGEPLLQSEFLAELLADDRLPRPRLLETNGMLPDRLAGLLPFVELISMDIKLPSNSGEPAFWDAHAKFLSLGKGKIYVKVLVDAGTDAAEVLRAASVVRETAPETPVFLQPVTGENGRSDLSQARLSEFFGLLRKDLSDVRVVPQTHKMLGIL